MTRVARIITDLGPTTSPSAVYAELARRMPSDVMLAFSSRVYRQLRQELHSAERIAEWATNLATVANRPVLFNVEFMDDTARTFAIAPPGWTSEKLAGYIAARHIELEEVFGPIERIGTDLGREAKPQ